MLLGDDEDKEGPVVRAFLSSGPEAPAPSASVRARLPFAIFDSDDRRLSCSARSDVGVCSVRLETMSQL